MQERRKYVRSDGLVLVNYRIPETKIEGKSSAHDVSGMGVRIIIDNKIKLQTTVEMEIYLPGNSQPVLAKGNVIWVKKCQDIAKTQITPKEEYFYAGINFTIIDEKNRKRITDYVQQKIHQGKEKP
ncbi:MAG: PilZ domain-containing protein [Omnitrophica bacterium]|nr:PilZ domain-containing protein [Candidatus Omnitrophota bacterium]